MIDHLLKIWPLILGGTGFCLWASTMLWNQSKASANIANLLKSHGEMHADHKKALENIAEHLEDHRNRTSDIHTRLRIVEDRFKRPKSQVGEEAA